MIDADIDIQLVIRAKAGDAVAFNKLVTKYQNKLFRIVNYMVRNVADTEDIVQDTFLCALRALPKFRGDSAFYTWLYRIGVNGANTHILKTGRASSRESVLFYDRDEMPCADTAIVNRTPLSDLENKEMIAVLDGYLQSMNTQLSTALLLREIDGLNYEQIAYVMGTPVGTVRSRIFRAREHIAAQLALSF